MLQLGFLLFDLHTQSIKCPYFLIGVVGGGVPGAGGQVLPGLGYGSKSIAK